MKRESRVVTSRSSKLARKNAGKALLVFLPTWQSTTMTKLSNKIFSRRILFVRGLKEALQSRPELRNLGSFRPQHNDKQQRGKINTPAGQRKEHTESTHRVGSVVSFCWTFVCMRQDGELRNKMAMVVDRRA